jgi:antirestriction protein ArdC
MTRSVDPVDARLAAAHEQLSAGVAALSSSEGWQRMLAVAARFHRYSPNNVLLIGVQRPEATLVAGYRSWQQLGRQVLRGERGIAILAPVLTRTENNPDSQPADPARVLRGFRVTHVFDVSQTEGDALPDAGPRLLAGGSPRGLWDALASQVHDAGFTLDRGDCGPANGYTDHVGHHVRVRDDVSSAQACKTLAHELAHVLLHGPDQPARLRHEAEVEAESVAYVVSTTAGLPTDGYSIPYVTSWSTGSTEVLRDAATRVLRTARLIIDRTGPPPDPLSQRSDPLARTQQLAAEHDPARDLRLAG